MRKILLTLSLLASLAGFSASSFAWVNVHEGLFISSSNAIAACVAGRSGTGSSDGCLQSSGWQNCGTGKPAGAIYVHGYRDGNGIDHCYHVSSGSCQSGQAADSAGKCVPACTIPGKESLPATDPLCVAAPTCTVGEAAEMRYVAVYETSHLVYGPTQPRPALQCDGSCVIAPDPSGQLGDCSGLDAEDATYPNPVRCSLPAKKTGDSCTVDDRATSAPSAVPQTPDLREPIICTDGMTQQADGSCAQPATAGTASTSTSTGTAATPGAVGCPVGMSSQLIGGEYHCVGAAPLHGIGCPPDYSRVGEDCVSNHVIAPGGSDPSKAGNCGAPGQPKCDTSDRTLLDTVKDIFKGPTTQQQSDTVAAGRSQGGLFDRVLAGEWTPEHGWGVSLPSIFPTAPDCSVWTFSVAGRQQVIDPCPTAYKIRTIAEFCLYVITLFALFRILFGPRAISRG